MAFALVICACTAPDTATRQDPPSARLDPPPETPSASSSPDTSSSSRAGYVELPDLLPRSLAGVELHTFAVGGDMLARLAATIGVDVSDVEVAFASEHGARFFQTYAIRASGFEANRLMEAFVNSAYDIAEGEVTVGDEVIAGKPVTVVLQPSSSARLGTYYAYAAEDVLFVVQVLDPVVAEEVLAALP